MKFLNPTLAASLFFSPVVAVPNVTAIPLGASSCRPWPNSHVAPDVDSSGGFQFFVTQSDDPGINDLPTTTQFWPTFGSSTNVTDIVITPRKSTRFAQLWFRCVDSLVQLPGGSPVSVYPDPYGGVMTLREGGYQLEAYAHEIGGVRQEGIFLGAHGSTTWGFVWSEPQGCGELDFYDAQLQGLPELPEGVVHHARKRPEFYGFIRVVPV